MLTKHFHSKFLREEYLDANKHLAYFKVLGVTISLVIYPLEWRHFLEWRHSVENGAILVSKSH